MVVIGGEIKRYIHLSMYSGLGLTVTLCLLIWLVQTDDYQIDLFVSLADYIVFPTYVLLMANIFFSLKGTISKRILSGIFSFLMITFVSFFILTWISWNTISFFDEVDLPKGVKIRLVHDPVPTDTVYSLWQTSGYSWWSWRRVPVSLTYSEGGEFQDSPSLEFSFDDKYLLVRRGGIWTDCIDLSSMMICEGIDQHPDWQNEQEWLNRSKQIGQITSNTSGQYIED